MTIIDTRPMMYGLDTLIQHGTGKMAPAVNLDNAATTPPFKAVVKEVQKQLRYYGSIGRGTGQKSRHSSVIYTEGRNTVLDFVNADKSKYTVFYANSTTDGINKLASALTNRIDKFGNQRNSDIMVISTRMEHHANDLPWRERAFDTLHAEVDPYTGRLIIEDIERLLKQYRHIDMPKYVAVTAASNVTGYVNDVHAIARVAHKYGAKIIVDGAQIVAHRQFSMAGTTGDDDIDFFVFSAHKMYSPFGGGAVVGLKSVMDELMPQFYGGGMVVTVSDDKAIYVEGPDLYEAGSPNVPGVAGLLKSIEILEGFGFDYIHKHEQILLRRALDGLSQLPGVTLYGDSNKIDDRVGIVTFNLNDWRPEDAADELAQISGISVRHGAFCSHPYVRRLCKEVPLTGSIKQPTGMIRASFGIYTTIEDVDLLVRTAMEMTEILPAFAGWTIPAREEILPNDRG